MTNKVRSSSRSRYSSGTVEKSPGREQGQAGQIQERCPYETFLPSLGFSATALGRANPPGSYSETGSMRGLQGERSGSASQGIAGTARAPYETQYETGQERAERKERKRAAKRPGTNGSQSGGGQGVMKNPKEVRSAMMREF